MFYIVALITVVICLGVIAIIVIRKFPLVASLEVESIPGEKEAQTKRELLGRRLEQQTVAIKQNWQKRLAPIKKIWGLLQLKFRIYVGKVERLWHHEEQIKKVKKLRQPGVGQLDKEKFDALMAEAGESLQNKNYEQAEQVFISAIKLDPASAAAYRGLGDAYNLRGSLEEARETYRYVLKLESDDDSVMVKLAEIAESQGDLEEAINYYQQAVVTNDSLAPRFYNLAALLFKIQQPVPAREAALSALELEPKNPKYLDLLVEIAILCGDRQTAEEAYQELRMANSENQKLSELKERIGKI